MKPWVSLGSTAALKPAWMGFLKADEAMFTVTLRFDGGCSPNPGQKYGSYAFSRISRGVEVLIKHRGRFSLGVGTNNEAEFESLILALEEGIKDCEAGGIDTGKLYLCLFTDSTIVANRLSKKNTAGNDARSLKMQTLALQCLDLLQRFGGFEIQWNDRSNNVAAFGH